MLRTKQLGTLSNYARTFIFSNSRCGNGDGASCTCSEDETCISKKQPSGSNFVAQEKQSGVVNEAPGSNYQKYENNVHIVVGSHILAPASLHAKVKLNSEVKKDPKKNGTRFVTEHFVRKKGNISSAGVFSELVGGVSPTDGHVHVSSQADNVPDSDNVGSSGGDSSQNRNGDFKSQTGSSIISLLELSDHNPQNKIKTGSARASKTTSLNFKLRESEVNEEEESQYVPQRVSANRVCNSTSSKRRVSANRVCNPTSSVSFQGGRNLYPNRPVNSGRVVERYHQTLQHLKWSNTAEAMLNNLCCKLDVFQANQVLKLLRDSSVAFGFFNWLKHQPGYKHDVHTYTTMIGILGLSRDLDAMQKLLEEMIQAGCKPTVVTYNRLIHAYGRSNYLNEAVRVFLYMKESGYVPDRVTYCTLIDIHAKAGYLDVALDLYWQMQQVGLSPDTFTYSAMVNCLGKSGHLTAADKLFSEMVKQGCVPNLVTYNIMIALQAKARNYPSAVKLYQDMRASGFRPDKVTYNIIMEVLGHCGRLEEAEAVFSEMRRDWVPDEPVYGLLVDLWGKAGDVDKARFWYRAMLDAGLCPNVPMCNSLLSAFLKVGKFKDAGVVLRNMVGLGLAPSLQTYTILLSCCTETWSDVRVCFELMEITSHPAHSFLLSLPDAEPGGRNVRSHVGSFLDLLHSEDRESKRGLLDAIIDFLHKSGLKEEAGSVWEVAARRNVYPDSVRRKGPAYWLVNLHVMSDGTAVTALSRTLAWFRRQLLESGVGPERIDIVTGWGRRSRVTGCSLVRRSVGDLLQVFDFPFFSPNGNCGCFVGCGEPLHRWLLNSYVERMHLL